MTQHIRIFKEDNEGSGALEREINKHLENTKSKIKFVNVVTEKIEGIDYMNVIITFEK